MSVLLDQTAQAAETGHKVKLVDTSSALRLYIDGNSYAKATKLPETKATDLLHDRNLTSKVELQQGAADFEFSSLIPTAIVLLIVGTLLYTFRHRISQLGPDALMGRFQKVRASQFIPDKTFSDIAGIERAKGELREIVDFLKEPDRWTRLGARTPRGVLLTGPTGTGKTLLAMAVAGEAGVPFYSLAGSAFVEMFVGVGASRVRDLFAQAKKNDKAIIFIDEIDALGKKRGSQAAGGDSEQEHALNQLLVEMDGFDTVSHVIVIAATNRPDILDSALMRPGRFDKQVGLDLPDQRGRAAILAIHTRTKPLSTNVDIDGIAHDTRGFSGADLAGLANQAAIEAVRRDGTEITKADFDEAYERIVLGPLKDSVPSPEDVRRTAIHELGHALVSYLLPGTDPVYKISIIAHGASGGHTRQRPENEIHIYPRSKLIGQLAFGMGGYIAEKIHYNGDISTGPGSDLEQMTERAWEMVCTYGMNDDIGPLVIKRGRAFGTDERSLSEEMRQKIDAGVQLLLQEAQDRALEILQPLAAQLDSFADALIEEETMDRTRLERLIAEARHALEENKDTAPGTNS